MHEHESHILKLNKELVATSTGLFLAVDQIKARLSALEAEIKPGTSDTSVTDQITALQKSVADLEDEVGAPDTVAATPASPAAAQ